MTYEALKAKAQKKADETGKTYCVAEDYSGFKVVLFNEKNFFSMAIQEVFEPGGRGNPVI